MDPHGPLCVGVAVAQVAHAPLDEGLPLLIEQVASVRCEHPRKHLGDVKKVKVRLGAGVEVEVR